MTTVSTIRNWLLAGKAKGATHVVVVCDTFDHSNYPVSVHAPQTARQVVDTYEGREMQCVIEVYDLSLDLEAQLAERYAWHL